MGRPPEELVPAVGNTRFAPTAAETHHVYLARTATAALLETVFHDVAGLNPTIYLAAAHDKAVVQVALTDDVRLIDLRDNALAQYGIARNQLVSTEAIHYRCIRAWADALHGRHIGGHRTVGCIWHSRQADLFAGANPGGLIADVLTHRAIEVAVLWRPGVAADILTTTAGPAPLVTASGPARLLVELSALVGAAIE